MRLKQIVLLAVVLCFVSLLFGFGVANAGTATLAWTQPAPDATHSAPAEFDVYRSTDSAICADTTKALPGPTLTIAPATTLTFVDSTLPNVNGVACYEVEAVNAGGKARSARASTVTTVNPPYAPALTVK